MKIQKNVLVLCVLIALVVGADSFYGGMTYGKSSGKGLMNRNFNPEQFGANVAGMGQRGGGLISGEVMAQDGQSITVKIKDTGTKIVFFSTSTQVMKTSTGLIGDIAIGSNLTITGKANSDGSVTAQSIQIRPSVPVPVVGK